MLSFRKRDRLLLGPLALALGLGTAPCLAAEATLDHGSWDRLLRRYVASGLVGYPGMAAEEKMLDAYLTSLRDIAPAHLSSREAQLAFWINAYNACVIKGVLAHYPLRSVKEVKGFFDKLRYRVARQDLTLNEIETRGRALGDFRIHFALVCASSSCPPLRNEAYLPERLDDQLAEQAKGFLADSQRGLRVEGTTLWASQIFKWYTKDFVSGRLTPSALLSVLAPQLPTALQAAQGERLTLKWLDYDWTLNERRGVR